MSVEVDAYMCNACGGRCLSRNGVVDCEMPDCRYVKVRCAILSEPEPEYVHPAIREALRDIRPEQVLGKKIWELGAAYGGCALSPRIRVIRRVVSRQSITMLHVVADDGRDYIVVFEGVEPVAHWQIYEPGRMYVTRGGVAIVLCGDAIHVYEHPGNYEKLKV